MGSKMNLAKHAVEATHPRASTDKINPVNSGSRSALDSLKRIPSIASRCTVLIVGGLAACASSALLAQDVVIERPGPPALEKFETDENKDGVPDGWYNLRGARMIPEGGTVAPGYVRFEDDKPGRQARISRAFGVNGTKTAALIIGLWIRLEHVHSGERVGDDPGLVIDFLGPGLRTVGRNSLGPWTQTIGSRWTHVSKRIPIPSDALDAIISIGLHGASGVLDIDGMSIELVPVGGEKTANLLLGGTFELGDPDPFGWLTEQGARRVSPGYRSTSALELTRSGSRAANGLGVSVQRLPALEVILMARGVGLRGAGGAALAVFFFDSDGRMIPGMTVGLPLFRWAGSFEWRIERTLVNVPPGAVRAVFQVEKADATGLLQIDDMSVTANPDPSAGEWTPYHIETDTSLWNSVSPSPEIVAGSALDASFLVPSPAGKLGFVDVRDQRLAFEKGGRARFFGVALLFPTAFIEATEADALATRLARSGVNLVRIGDLDAPLGPGRSLLDDSRDDTLELDPLALRKLDHLISALKSRGIYIALELQSMRRYRAGDGLEGYRSLSPGGGPAAAFDPTIRSRVLKTAEDLLTHVNPETGLALRDDPVLAWITVAGELTLFDLIEHPELLPTEASDALKKLAQMHTGSSARKFWQATEAEQWRSLAQGLRALKLRVPIAGSSHYRREPPEFVAAQSSQGLSLIDDRLYWSSPLWGSPDRRSMLRGPSTSLPAAASKKRQTDRPYVVGQWCDHTEGAWALPYEGADLMLAALSASSEDWDALVRRGVFLFPEVWGANATGTGGGEDFYAVPEVINGIPQVFALLPHAASIVLRGYERVPKVRPGFRGTNSTQRAGVPGWDREQGRLVIDTPYTQGLGGWPGGLSANFESLAVDVDSVYAVVVATAMSSEPITTTKRLLVSAIARVEPTGFRWVDEWKRDVADPGRPPLLQEPVRAKVLWRHSGNVKGFALDNTGKRTGPVALEKTADGVRLAIDGTTPTLHWELVEE
jgi:hypothetical protein